MKKVSLRIIISLLFLTFLALTFSQPLYAQFVTEFHPLEPQSAATPGKVCGPGGCSKPAPEQPKSAEPTKQQPQSPPVSQSGVKARAIGIENQAGKSGFGAKAETALKYDNNSYKKIPESGDVHTAIAEGQKNSKGSVKITLVDMVDGNGLDKKGKPVEGFKEGDVRYKSGTYNHSTNTTLLVAEYFSDPKEGIMPWAENYLAGYVKPAAGEQSKSLGQLTESIQPLKEDSKLYGMIIAMDRAGGQKEIAGAVLWFKDPGQYKVARYVEQEGKGWFISENTTLEDLLTDLNVNQNDKLTALVRAGKLAGDGISMPETYLVGKTEVTVKDFAYDLEPFIKLGQDFSIPNIEALVMNRPASVDPFLQGIPRLQQLMEGSDKIGQMTFIGKGLDGKGPDEILARFNFTPEGKYKLTESSEAVKKLTDLPDKVGVVVRLLNKFDASGTLFLKDAKAERLGFVERSALEALLKEKIKQ